MTCGSTFWEDRKRVGKLPGSVTWAGKVRKVFIKWPIGINLVLHRRAQSRVIPELYTICTQFLWSHRPRGVLRISRDRDRMIEGFFWV